MTKVTLSHVSNLQDTTTAASTINTDLDTIVTAFDNTLSLNGATPNQMGANLDMNSHQIINLPSPSTVNSPARLIDVTSNPTIVVPTVGTSGATVPLLSGNNTWSGTNTYSSPITVNANATFNNPVTFGSTISFPGAITNSNLATMANNTIKGNVSGSTAVPSDLTSGQVATILQPTYDALYAKTAGNNTWTGDNFFKDGRPWTDVRAWGAVGDNITSDSTAIQNAINYMNSTYSGGVVFVPPGNYKITTGLVMKGGVRLIGAGKYVTVLNGNNTDVTTVTFDSSCGRGCSLECLFVNGYYNATVGLVTSNAIEIVDNMSVIIRDVTAWFGNAALFTKGIDCTFDNCYFMGCVNGVVSNGANWYIRCQLDTNGAFGSYTNAFLQGTKFTGASSQENNFVQCDFSGPFTNAISIAGSAVATPPTITIFQGCVFSSPISISGAYWTSFTGCELGATITLGGSGGNVSVVGCAGIGGVFNLVGAFSKAGNYNIT